MPSDRNRKLRWFYSTCVPIVLSLLGSTAYSFFPGGVAGFLTQVLALFGPAISALITSIIVFAAFCKRQWRRALSLSGALLVAMPLVAFAMACGDYIHLVMSYPFYRAKISAEPNSVHRFAWGDAAITAIDGVHLRVLVYDPGHAHQELNRTVRSHQDEPALKIFTRHLLGNFYLEEIAPQ